MNQTEPNDGVTLMNGEVSILITKMVRPMRSENDPTKYTARLEIRAKFPNGKDLITPHGSYTWLTDPKEVEQAAHELSRELGIRVYYR